MPFNGSGTFTRQFNWKQDKINNQKIQAARMDDEFDGVATGLSSCITKDGQTTVTAPIPFNSQRLTQVGAPTLGTDALNRDAADGRYVFRSGGAAQNASILYLGGSAIGPKLQVDTTDHGRVWTDIYAPASFVGASGYQKLPNGLIIQWVSATFIGYADGALSFPVAWPTGCLSIAGSVESGGDTGSTLYGVRFDGITTTSFNARVRAAANGGAVYAATSNIPWHMIAVGF